MCAEVSHEIRRFTDSTNKDRLTTAAARVASRREGSRIKRRPPASYVHQYCQLKAHNKRSELTRFVSVASDITGRYEVFSFEQNERKSEIRRTGSPIVRRSIREDHSPLFAVLEDTSPESGGRLLETASPLQISTRKIIAR